MFASVQANDTNSNALALRGEKRGHSYVLRLKMPALTEVARIMVLGTQGVHLFLLLPPCVQGFACLVF